MLWEAHTVANHVEEHQSLAAFVVVVTIFMIFQSNTCDFWGEKLQKNAVSVRTTGEDTNKRDCSCQYFTQEEKKRKKEKQKLWDFSDSNQGPIDLQSNALPAAPKSLSLFYSLTHTFTHYLNFNTALQVIHICGHICIACCKSLHCLF